MDARASSRSPTRLQPPPRRSLEDPGAHELDSSENEDDHFSDASEGRQSRPASPSKLGVPGESDTGPYGFDDTDTPPEQESFAESERVRGSGRRSSKVNEQAIPTTVVEKVDPFTASYGEVPGTMAYEMRRADAEPDVVVGSEVQEDFRPRSGSTPGNLPVPTTKLSVVDASPTRGDMPGRKADVKHKEDAEPDVVVQEADPDPQEARYTRSVSPDESNVMDRTHGEDKSSDMAMGADSDDFEEGELDEDFGDFDNGFNDDATAAGDKGIEHIAVNASPSLLAAEVPLLDYSTMAGPDEVITATSRYLDGIFPWESEAESNSADLLGDGDSMFITERSLSLWSQLVAAPPLQPPNWVRSRIRRLFLVSLGVPVDLDEILPASKQKKLVLPSLQRQPDSNSRSGEGGAVLESRQSKSSEIPAASNPNQAPSESPRRKGPPSPPDLDLGAARLICATTDAALAGFSMEELREHIERVERLTQQARETLEYWLKRKEGALGDKEAFEGVIENLVKHARRARK